jgi:hypothetical protein
LIVKWEFADDEIMLVSSSTLLSGVSAVRAEFPLAVPVQRVLHSMRISLTYWLDCRHSELDGLDENTLWNTSGQPRNHPQFRFLEPLATICRATVLAVLLVGSCGLDHQTGTQETK